MNGNRETKGIDDVYDIGRGLSEFFQYSLSFGETSGVQNYVFNKNSNYGTAILLAEL